MLELDFVASRVERRARRVSVEHPVAVRSVADDSVQLTGVTRDVSACGVYVYLDDDLPVGSPVEVFVAADTGPSWHAFGRVVRTEDAGERAGLAITLENMATAAKA